MKKTLSKELTLYFTSNFPKSFSESNKINYVVIGIGGNLGNVKRVFDKLFLSLQADNRFDIIKTSPILKNPPFGFLDQDDFLNAVVLLKTDLSPKASLRAFQRMENRFKRKRSFKDAPRTLDIDIIFFNDLKMDSKILTIPHPHWYKRDSVTLPLSYILDKR